MLYQTLHQLYPMTSELTINVQPDSIQIAITEDHNLVEYQKDAQEVTFAVGNLYLGRVKKLMPGLNACFVDVGSDKEAFLHYQDLGPQFASLKKYIKQVRANRKKLAPFSKAQPVQFDEKSGNISTALEQGDEIVVQVTKEPISTKGPRLTGEISFAGRFLVLIPFSDKVSVSSKIKSNEERARLKQLIHSIKPKNCGVIVRTVAEGKRVAELDNELSILYQRWEDCLTRAQKAEKAPALIFEETSRTIAILRDMLNSSYESIHVNDEKTYQEIRDYVSLIDPEKTRIVKLYKGELPIFDNFAITKQIKSSFGRIVSYKSGAYLIIEHTEALHVVDVNSGHRVKAGTQEENALEVNLGAADELARQLRLRDMGGIIVVDFIDMALAEDRQKLYERINARVDTMLEKGLLSEAKAAYEAGISGGGGQAIGHKEFFPYFRGEQTLCEAVETLKRSTRRYAKRQLTWFNRDKRINWIYRDITPDVFCEAKKIIEKEEKENA